MAENVGKLEIVIKGGKPWGFRLKSFSESRSAIVIDYIEPGGKAETHGGLKVGDHVIKINDVLCLSLADALQLIDSAFRTLTILVWRPSYFSQEDKRIQNKISVPQTENFTSLPLTFCDSKLNLATIQNIRSYAVFSNYNDKYIATSSSSNTQEFLYSLPHKFKDSAQHPSQAVSNGKDWCKTNYEESFNKSKNHFNDGSFVPFQSSQYHPNTNTRYICEQYPLSKLCFNQKSEIEVQSITSHSEKFVTSQSKAGQVQDFNLTLEHNTKNLNEVPSQVVNSSALNVAESVCCMYPECHSRYKNCNMHSPPERDLAVPQTKIFDYPSDTIQSFKYKQEEKYGLDSNSSGKLIDGQSPKNFNCSLYENVKLITEHLSSTNLKNVSTKNALEMSEDGFRNRGLKIFKPVNLSPKTRLACPDYYGCRRQRRDQSNYNTETASLNSEHSNGGETASDNHLSLFNKDIKFNRYKNKISHQTFSTEITPDVSMKHTVFISHSKQNNLSQHEKITEQKNSTYETCNQRENSKTLSQTTYQGSYFNEEQHSMFLHTNEFKMQFANETSTVNLYAESSKSDGDEDEELCLIEENARNNNCFITSPSRSETPDLALPPPPFNDDTEIIPSNDPLPPPPSFSPVKEVIYENIEINKIPNEAIYANLEMLKIKCSVVNSATQTSVPSLNSYQPSDTASKKDSQALSLFGTEMYSNIVGPMFGNKPRSDYLKSFLESQCQGTSKVLKECILKSEEKYSVERLDLCLPLTSAYFTTSEPKAKLLTRHISSLHKQDAITGELSNKKEELISSINKKLGILRLEQITLNEEIKQNEELGYSLQEKLEKVALQCEIDKFKTHVAELEKITNLMTSLSGRLARAENALLILPSDASSKEKNVLQEKFTRLNQQYEEASHLKKSIDRRNSQVCMFLRKYFSEEEYGDYDHFISMKAKLLLDYRELDEKIKLGEEQLEALKNSINNQSIKKIKDC